MEGLESVDEIEPLLAAANLSGPYSLVADSRERLLFSIGYWRYKPKSDNLKALTVERSDWPEELKGKVRRVEWLQRRAVVDGSEPDADDR